MDYLKTADEIVDVYFVTYIESCDKNNNSHSTSWRNRYIGQDGVIYILKNGNRQFFVWHPVDDDFKPITSLGIISSRYDYYIKKMAARLSSHQVHYEKSGIYSRTNITF